MEQIIYPLIGGVIIGLASTVMLGGIGKISGISGIYSGLFNKIEKEDLWKYLFVLGLLLGGGFMYLIAPQFFQYQANFSYTQAIVAGLLVGYGTRLGSGCTSGHGVCGLPRLSARSLVATLTFMGAGIITVFIKGIL